MIRRVLRAIVAVAPLAAGPLVAAALACNSGASGQPGSADGSGAIADAPGESASDAGVVDATVVECVPDGAAGGNCNSCATLATDPYNVCSAFVDNCVPFAAARVPVHPDL